MKRFLALFLLAFALVSSSSLAFAQDGEGDEERHEEAIRLFQLGELHYSGDDFVSAAEAFGNAYDLEMQTADPVGLDVLALNAALAYENAGQLEQAVLWFERVVEHTSNSDLEGQATRGINRINAILESLAEQQQMQMGRIVVDSTPEGAAVFIGEEESGMTPFVAELEPGQYEITLRLEGYEDYVEPVVVDPAGTARLSLSMQETVVEENVDGPGDPIEEELVEVHRGSWVPTIIVGTVAIGSTVAGALFANQAISREDDLSDPDVLRDDSLFDDTRSEGESAQTLSTVFYGVAIGAGVGTIVTFLITRPRTEMVPASQARFRVDPWLGRGSAGASFGLRF